MLPFSCSPAGLLVVNIMVSAVNFCFYVAAADLYLCAVIINCKLSSVHIFFFTLVAWLMKYNAFTALIHVSLLLCKFFFKSTGDTCWCAAVLAGFCQFLMGGDYCRQSPICYAHLGICLHGVMRSEARGPVSSPKIHTEMFQNAKV